MKAVEMTVNVRQVRVVSSCPAYLLQNVYGIVTVLMGRCAPIRVTAKQRQAVKTIQTVQGPRFVSITRVFEAAVTIMTVM